MGRCLNSIPGDRHINTVTATVMPLMIIGGKYVVFQRPVATKDMEVRSMYGYIQDKIQTKDTERLRNLTEVVYTLPNLSLHNHNQSNSS